MPPVADQPPLDADQQALRARIVAMGLTGGTLQAIARTLNLEESTAALETLASLQSGEVTHSGQLAMARLDAVEAQGWAVLRHAVTRTARRTPRRCSAP